MLTTPTSTKDKLVRAALEIGAQDGLESATTAAIAAKAGVAEGTLYRHFPSKDDLLIEVYRGIKRRIFEAISDGESGDEAPDARLKRVWRKLYDTYRGDTQAFLFGQRFAKSASQSAKAARRTNRSPRPSAGCAGPASSAGSSRTCQATCWATCSSRLSARC